MFNIEEFLAVLEEYAPLQISYKAIEKGDYDNSGLLVKNGKNVSKILFSLDLSDLSFKAAEKMGADTIVTHHPAIYNPIKKLSFNGENKDLLSAIKAGMNVISMHLNLDMANDGIDAFLAEGLGGKAFKILDDLDGEHGYGREFVLKGDAEEILIGVKKTFGSDKILLYGSGEVNKAASFCGGGSDYAFSCVIGGKTDADLIVTSDMPHHVLKELIECGKKVMIIPHYVSENYGFKKFYLWAKEKTCLEAEYFEDKRFM